MARAMWSGIVSFGLVSIPVKLYAATESKAISFNQIHAKCKTKIQEKRWCPACEVEVPWEDIEKGYQYAKGQYISITAEDLESVPLPSKQVIAVQSFVKLEEIDPVFFEKSYYLEPEEKVMRPFVLFMETLKAKGVVGIGLFTIRTKERLCCLRPIGGNLMLDTLLYPDEVRIDLNKELPAVKLTAQEKTMAASLVEMMEQPFDASNMTDNYREALQKIIDEKLEGLPVEYPRAVAAHSSGTPDLMESLRNSLASLSDHKAKGAKAKATNTKIRTRVNSKSENAPAKKRPIAIVKEAAERNAKKSVKKKQVS